MPSEIYGLVPLPIKPNIFRRALIKAKILKALYEVGRLMKKDWEDVVSTFEHKVRIKSTLPKRRGGDWFVSAGSDDQILHYLDVGTSQRWAIMNNPYTSKTKMGASFKSGPGARTYNRKGYYTAIRGRRAMLERGIPPQPGIAARRYSVRIARKWQPVLTARIRLAIAYSIRRR